MSESDLYGPIRSLSRGPVRLFRQNAGLAWQGNVIERTPTRLILAHPRPLRMGVPGLSDFGGLASHTVTEADIGRVLAVYLAIEAKFGRARPTEEQAAFLAMVQRLGGRAGVARSVEDAEAIIRGIP